MSINVGEKFKLIRATTGLNQIKFAELIDINISSYKKYESGHTEVGAPALLTVANHPQFKKYALWLVTGETAPDAGQYAPSDKVIDSGSLSHEEYETQFVDAAAQSLLMFCHLDWFRPNKEKGVDFNDCAKLLMKDLKPIISARYDNSSNKIKTA